MSYIVFYCKTMNSEQQLSSHLLKLPIDLHHVIIKTCMQQYILPDLLATNCVKQSVKYINLLQHIHAAVIVYIANVRRLNEDGNLYFMTCIDALEDRILEDEWYVWDKSQQCLKIIEITKSYVSAPQCIQIEIECMFLHGNTDYDVLQSLFRNIVMLSRMLT